MEAVGYSKRRFSGDEFKSTMTAFITNDTILPLTITGAAYDLRVSGRLFGGLSQAKVLIGKPAKPELYENMRFRFQVTLLQDGRISVRAYEHVLGFPKERRAMQSLFDVRVNQVLQFLEKSGVANDE